MPEEAPIEEQLSSVSISSPAPATKASITSLQDLEPPRRSAAAAAAASPSAAPSLPSDVTTSTNASSTSPPPPSDLTEIENIAYHATPATSTLPSHRSHDPGNNLKRSDPFQFGSRYLEAGDDVFEWNAWDHVDPSKDELFVAYAQRQFEFQREHRLSEFERRRFNKEPEKWWDKFYGNNKERFFKDRKWLKQEFPVLERCCAGPVEEQEGGNRRVVGGSEDRAENRQPVTTTDSSTDSSSQEDQPPSIPALTSELNGPARPGGDWLPPPTPDSSNTATSQPFNTILEIGAGAGNTAYPVLAQNRNPHLMIHATDFSKKAVDIIRSNPAYDGRHIRSEVWDMASVTQSLPTGVEPGSVDVVMLIFAFSALNPRQWAQAVRNVYAALRPGGEVCFRDYGRGDLAQVRFKKGRLLEENFYIRGDGTRVYFFEIEELRRIWGGRLAEALPAFEVRGAVARETDVTAGGSSGDGDAPKEDSKDSGEVGENAAKPAPDADDEGDSHDRTAGAAAGITNEDDDGDREQTEAAKQMLEDAKSAPAFEILALAADRRLLVNRSSRLKMYRCWMQGRFRKPFAATGSDGGAVAS